MNRSSPFPSLVALALASCLASGCGGGSSGGEPGMPRAPILGDGASGDGSGDGGGTTVPLEPLRPDAPTIGPAPIDNGAPVVPPVVPASPEASARPEVPSLPETPVLPTAPALPTAPDLPETPPDALPPPETSTPPELPAPLAALRADPAIADRVPTVADVETLADSGLQVAYTDLAQRAFVEPLRVGAQWQYMQSCIEVVATPPLVLIRPEVEPFTDSDDVLRDIEGRRTASSSRLVDGSSVVQLRDAPFDGSSADAGFGLMRQIMGRHLWLSAGLEARAYPAECAREAPPESAPYPPESADDDLLEF